MLEPRQLVVFRFSINRLVSTLNVVVALLKMIISSMIYLVLSAAEIEMLHSFKISYNFDGNHSPAFRHNLLSSLQR